MRDLLDRLIRDDDGQDLVEYAFLAAFVALTTVAALALLQATLQRAYSTWNANIEDLWSMPDPGSG
jgi:Flp pilus assembly pilin Flp